MVSKGNITTKANQGAVQSILRNLALIKTKRVASKSSEKWADYEVEESSGSRVKAYAGDKLLEDFIVGRFNFNQQTRSATSYIRRSNDDNVYAIDGFLSMSINQSMDSFRDKSVVDVQSSELNLISLESETGTSTLRKENLWIDLNGNVKDSTAMVNFVNRLSKVNGATFYNSTPPTSETIKKLTLSGSNGQSTTVSCFHENGEFIIQSSQNPDAYFTSDSIGIFKTLFLDDLLLN